MRARGADGGSPLFIILQVEARLAGDTPSLLSPRADARTRALARLDALEDEEEAVRAALAEAESVGEGGEGGGGRDRGPAPDEDAWSDDDGAGVKSEPAPSPRGGQQRALQRALLTSRLDGLASRRAALETALKKEEPGSGGGARPVAPRPPSAAPPLADDALESALAAAGGGGLVETERDRLIRLGVLTPFDAVGGFERRVAGGGVGAGPTVDAAAARMAAALAAADAAKPRTTLLPPAMLPPRERAVGRVDPRLWRAGGNARAGAPRAAPRPARPVLPSPPAALRSPRGAAARKRQRGGSDADADAASSSDDDDAAADADAVFDDADESTYAARLAASRWPDGAPVEAGEGPPPCPSDALFDGGLRVPSPLWARLFPYQRTGVKWLWELHGQRVGGVVGDEMGLGKTVQVAALLAALAASGRARPALIIAPATVLTQWVRELRAWAPCLRVFLHHPQAAAPPGTHRPAPAALLRTALATPHAVVVTSYDALRRGRDGLAGARWGCAVLDEGHRIRTPDAAVTLAAKTLATVHRIVLTGAPVQNRLEELW